MPRPFCAAVSAIPDGWRGAVHTGEVELAGHEIHGVAVHETSWMMSHAGEGEVLVSEFTRAFAGESQLQFEDSGEVELGGFSESVRLHSVTR